ncbi:MAG: hypothetical protein EXR75_08265 [Myxococcales bacterium]|nr:hypothetical protein [Myxococcales bacterium]
MLTGRPLALVLLAWSLVKVLVRRIFGRSESGLAAFHANYGGEGLAALDADERTMLPACSRCIACGRCDHGEAERITASNGEYPGLMQLVLASSRSIPDFHLTKRAFAHVPDDVLANKTRDCPTRVPFLAIKRLVAQKARNVLD